MSGESIDAAVTVRRAVPGDEPMLRALRIRALTLSPEAFGSTLEREKARTDADWSRWITASAVFLAERDGATRGMAACVRHREDPEARFLEAMWLDPELRGSGAGDALVEAVAACAADQGARSLWLHVGAANHPAIRLYERRGFAATGATFVRERDGSIEVEMRRALGTGA